MSFQPFAVQCLTCGSQLRVTDPSLVGTIATCPKCNSMVQIDRPDAGQVAVGRSGVDSQAITEEGIDPTESAQPTHDRGFAGETPAADSDPAIAAAPPDWQSDRTKQLRQVTLVAAVAVSGLLSAVVVFGWFVRTWREESAQDVAARTEAPPEVAIPDTPDIPDAPNKDDEPAAAGAPDSEPGDQQNAVEEPANDAVAASPDATGATATEQDPEPPLSVPNDLIPQSPLSEPAVIATPVETETSPAEAPGMQELPPSLAQYTQLLVLDEAAEPPNLQAPPTMDDVVIEAAAVDRDGPIVLESPEPLNLKRDLSRRLALASDGYPLADLMLLISHFTGVPIQVDWVSFDLAGIDLRTEVPTVKGWSTVGDVLNEAASAVGAELRPDESVLVLTLSDDRFNEMIATVTDTQDFQDGRDSAETVINNFLGHDSESDRLQIGATREDQQRAALAIDVLRRMRGVPPRVEDQSLRRWAGPTRDSVEWPLVSNEDSGPRFDTPIPIAGFLRRTARLSDVACVVNWYDAQRRSASPEDLVLPNADLDTATLFAQTLDPFGLQVRAVDNRHWWVGNKATYDRLTAFIWTEPLGDARESFEQRIQTIMQGSSSERFRMAIDDDSDRALLMLPRFIVRQLPKIAPAITSQ